METLKKIDDIFVKTITYFCVVLFIGIVVVGVLNVFFRYVLNHSLSWGEEVMRYMCIWMVLVGSSLTIRSDGHMSIDFIQSLVKNPRGKVVMYAATRIIGALALICLFPASIQLIQNMGNVVSPASRIPMWAVYSAFPVGVVCSIVAYIRSVPHYSKKILDEEAGGE